MRHVEITRLTVAIAGIFVAGAILFAATRPSEDTAARDPAVGAAAFAAHCAHCHGTGDFPRWASRQPDPEERRQWMDRLLQRHHPPPSASRTLIVDHIERVLASGG